MNAHINVISPPTDPIPNQGHAFLQKLRCVIGAGDSVPSVQLLPALHEFHVAGVGH